MSEEAATFGHSIIHKDSPQQVPPHVLFGSFYTDPPSKGLCICSQNQTGDHCTVEPLTYTMSKKAVITVTDVWLKLTSQPGTINQSTEDKAMCGISYAFSAVNLSVWYQHNLHNTWDSIYGHVSYPFNQGHGWGCLLSTDNVCYTWKDISTNFLLLYWRDQNQQLVCLSDSILFAPQALFIPAVNTCSKCKSVQFVCLYMFWLLFDYKVIFGP